ncbi:hypothetical protein D2A34_12465 [Clostridium chromiireducens]|uniref:Uncharacterized protein n=1 Tax=Clostridium chromiireducens TaxID=225345 RepID=A0A399ILT9_9CLOT|nr:hypothetical protein D2A34_12465 [Clostridium chromiireducens]
MVIGIRYCGGCNASYDRKDFVTKLIKNLDSIHNFEIAKENKEYDYLILVCGCFNCCVSHEKYISNNKIFIKSINDYTKLLSNLKEF